MKLNWHRAEMVRREAYIVDVGGKMYMLRLYFDDNCKVIDSSLCDAAYQHVADPDLQESITDFVHKVS
jgi:hypothetical protein